MAGKKPKKAKKDSKLKRVLRKEIDIIFKTETKALNYKQVGALLKIADAPTRKLVYEILTEMAFENKVEEVEIGKFKAKYRPSNKVGVVDMTSRGAAYIVVEGEKSDVFVKPYNLNKALHGDKVAVNIFRKRGGKFEGEVIEIVERAKTEFVGIIEIKPNFAFVVMGGTKMNTDIFVPKSKLNGAENGQKVVVKMTDWPDGADSPFGEVTKVLGNPGEIGAEMDSVLVEFGFPLSFPDWVEAEAARIPVEIEPEEIAKRKDYRGITTFTIDPVDAKDFDDALSFRILENGNFEIGVHIADVTHYVHEHGKIDVEAYKRATSVYLVDRVIPMLPEVLSNRLCSLRPQEEKLTYACIFEMNDKAKVLKHEIVKTVIYSDRRFTYEEVQEILEGAEGDFKPELEQLNALAKTLREARMKSGAINFEKAEVRFSLDEEHQPTGVFLKVQKDAHKLIEEFMLLANRTVAESIGKKTNPKPFVYRIHDQPDPMKVQEFGNFIRKFGYKFNHSGGDIAKPLNDLINELHGKREENIINQMAIRTMAKAIYSTENIGHYGLSFKHYSHFTSPIRRYPDMMAHRLLFDYANHKAAPDLKALEQGCKVSSEMEKKAADAERASTKFFQVLYMKNNVGQEFNGYISGVSEWGIYVELAESKCEGMVRLKDLSDDVYFHDEANFRIVGHNKGKVFGLGDAVRIRIKNADLVNKFLDFEMVDIVALER